MGSGRRLYHSGCPFGVSPDPTRGPSLLVAGALFAPPHLMKFRFRHIPPIEEADLELGDFTIIAGRNNSGKTYLSYALYGFLKQCRAWPVERHEHDLGHPDWAAVEENVSAGGRAPSWAQVASTITSAGRIALRVTPAALSTHRSHLAKLLAADFVREQLPSVFQTDPHEFDGASIEFEFDGDEVAPEPFGFVYAPESRLVLRYKGEILEISARRDDGQAVASHPWLNQALLRAYSLFLFSAVPRPFVLTGERLGIALFYRELDFTKNKLVELLQEHTRKGGRTDPDVPYLVIEKASSRYALPIKDNITHTRSLADTNGHRSAHARVNVAPSLSDPYARWSAFVKETIGSDLERLADGRFTASDGELRFVSLDGSSRAFDVPLHRASSSARALMEFDFFIRHDAKQGQLLIVDEPESHLDVNNQVRLARLLARIATAGLRVLVTTHSDYFVKEINNLIMAARLGTESRAVRAVGYESEARLPASAVRAYATEDGIVRRCNVDDFGAEIPVFEQAAREIDRRSRRLAIELHQLIGD